MCVCECVCVHACLRASVSLVVFFCMGACVWVCVCQYRWPASTSDRGLLSPGSGMWRKVSRRASALTATPLTGPATQISLKGVFWGTFKWPYSHQCFQAAGVGLRLLSDTLFSSVGWLGEHSFPHTPLLSVKAITTEVSPHAVYVVSGMGIWHQLSS